MEGTMHIHGNSMNVNAVSFYSSGNRERAAAAERTAAVRKRLLNAADAVDAPTSEESLMIGQWLGSPQSQTEADAEYRSGYSGKDPDLG
jgi:hypothetical protein